MANANQEYFDASLRHQIGVRRFSTQQVLRMIELLDKSDRSLLAKLQRGVSPLTGKPYTPETRARISEMLQGIRRQRGELIKEVQLEFKDTLREFAKTEVLFEVGSMQASIPFEIQLNQPNLIQVAAAAVTEPFSSGPGRASTLEQWFSGLQDYEQRQLRESIQLGIIQGESIDKIVSRVTGTAANNFQDGVLSVTRRNAESVVRTAVNHVSNTARESVWDANEDIIAAVRWVSTLDGRTSAICRARDGQMAPIGDKPLPEGAVPLQPPDARPPAHINCRSVTVALVDGEGVMNQVGDRPFITDSRTRRQRELDFAREARERGVPIQEVRRRWQDRAIGRVPKDTTYQDWLGRQPVAFQDDVLGKTKGLLFRKGELKLDKFVDRQGQELTLSQLATQNRSAFVKAGLNPDDFLDD